MWYFLSVRKSIGNSHVRLKYDKSKGYCTWKRIYVHHNVSLKSSWNEKLFYRRSFRENRNTNFMLKFFSENRGFYEVMWNNILEPDKQQIKIRRMGIACCIPKPTAHTLCNIYCFSTATMVTWTRLNVTYILTLNVLIFYKSSGSGTASEMFRLFTQKKTDVRHPLPTHVSA